MVIQIEATINQNTSGLTISNQAQIAYDGDGDGVNETQVVTDDPAVGGVDDPTSIRLGGVVSVPTLGAAGLTALALLLAGVALVVMRRSLAG